MTQGSVAAPGRFGTTFSALRYPNYRRWFVGQVLSLMGTWMQMVAQGWLVYDLTGSKLALGTISFISSVPTLVFMLPAGAVANRVSRRKMMLVTQTVMMISAFILAFFTGTKSLQVWYIAVLGFILGLAGAFDAPARMALTVELIDDRRDAAERHRIELHDVQLGTRRRPGHRWPDPGDRGRHLVFRPQRPQLRGGADRAGGHASPRADQAAEHPPHDRRDRRRAALRVGHKGGARPRGDGGSCLDLRVLLFGADASLRGGGAGRGRGRSGRAHGGGRRGHADRLAGGRQPDTPRHKGWQLSFGSVLFPIALIAFALSRNFYLSLVILVFVGFGFIIQNTTGNTLVQMLVPDQFRGRVMSVYTLMFMGAMPFGSLLAGTLAQVYGTSAAVIFGASITLAFALFVVIFIPQVRRLEN